MVDSNVKFPGPGKYDEKIANVKEKTPSWRIGTDKRETFYKVNDKRVGPGPGRYDIKTSHSGPFVLMHSRFESKNKNKLTTPGPGFYKIPCSFRDIPKYNVGGSFDENFRWV